MAADAIEDDLSRRFRIERPATLLARNSSKARVVFSRMRSNHPMRGRSLAASPQEAFAFHVPLSVPFFSNLWTAGRRREVPDWRLGHAQLVDLGDGPVVSLDTPFDSIRFGITQVALDEMANEAGIPRVRGLYAPNFGARDPIMYGLAQALAGAMEQPGEGTAMFADCIALAFFAHIVRAYGSIPIGGRNARGGLAAWQLKRARDLLNVNLAHDPSIEEIAHECGLSSSYFARAFKRSTGVPPSRWLTKMRVERAKELLKDPRCELAEIALQCGFVDQSHFTRVFSKSEGYSPGRWRRLHRL
ncbi:helix-turn-helix domain-containing protein [Bradyrhizobium sp. Pha-3]|uniref:helix-turn-helix domain-containing protein n=1 Tax=Bradyrhizobium sp. Pha-3 TaxID=208375 RepID=UPI0035D4B10B